MRAQQLQRQLKFNAEALTSMYKRYSELRAERKKFNDLADCIAQDAIFDEHSDDVLDSLCKQENTFRMQGGLFTPHINKLRKRIAALEDIQVALKHELKCAACLDAWERVDDQEWLQRAAMAQEEGFVWSGNGEEFIARFGEVE